VFLVMLNRCDPAGAVSLAENLRATVCAKPVQATTKPLMVTISVGVALTSGFPQQDLDEIIHAADVALYGAKPAGRNCVRVAQSLPADGGKENVQPENPVLTP
jgi:diguanylate cyclase (GGDEF)-like protein